MLSDEVLQEAFRLVTNINEGTLGSVGLTDETDETVDAQIVDIGIVGGALTREIHAEVGAVGAQGMRQMRERQVVLQVELRVLTLLLGTCTRYLSHTFLNVSAKTISMIRKDITFGND